MVYGVGLFLGDSSIWHPSSSTTGWPESTTATTAAETIRGVQNFGLDRAAVHAQAPESTRRCQEAGAQLLSSARKSMLSPAAPPFTLPPSCASTSSSWSSAGFVQSPQAWQSQQGAAWFTSHVEDFEAGHQQHAPGAPVPAQHVLPSLVSGAQSPSISSAAVAPETSSDSRSTKAATSHGSSQPQSRHKKGKKKGAGAASGLTRAPSSCTDSSGSERGSCDSSSMPKDLRAGLVQAAHVVYAGKTPEQLVRCTAAVAAVTAQHGPLGPGSITEAALVRRLAQTVSKAWSALPAAAHRSPLLALFEPSDGILRVVPWEDGEQVLMIDFVDLLFQLAWIVFPGHNHQDEARRALVHVLAGSRSGPAGPLSLGLDKLHQRLASELPAAAAAALSQLPTKDLEQLGVGCLVVTPGIKEGPHGGSTSTSNVRLDVHVLADWGAACNVAARIAGHGPMSASQVHMDRLVLCAAALAYWGPRPSQLLGAGLAVAAEYPWHHVAKPGGSKLEYVTKLMDHCCRVSAGGFAATARPTQPDTAQLRQVLQQERLFCVRESAISSTSGSTFGALVQLNVRGLCARVARGVFAAHVGALCRDAGSSSSAVSAHDAAGSAGDLQAEQRGGSAAGTGALSSDAAASRGAEPVPHAAGSINWPPDASRLRAEAFGLQLRGLLLDLRAALASDARDHVLACWLHRMHDLAAGQGELPAAVQDEEALYTA